jgi:hypothetical protein
MFIANCLKQLDRTRHFFVGRTLNGPTTEILSMASEHLKTVPLIFQGATFSHYM